MVTDMSKQTTPAVMQEKVNYDYDVMPLYIHRTTLSKYLTLNRGCHFHEDIEFFYVLSGHCTYFINGQLCRMEAGEGIFVNSGHFHNGCKNRICNHISAIYPEYFTFSVSV